VVLFCVPTGVLGQGVSLAPKIQSYEMSSPESVRLQYLRVLSVPLAATLPLADWADADVRGGFADASLSLPNGESGSVSGFVDATVALEARRGPLSASLVAILPTGKVVQDYEEAVVVGILASELFPVPMQQLGSGGGVGLDVAYVTRWRSTSLGLSAGAVRLGGSEPFGSTDIRYQPGVQLRGRVVVESHAGEAGILTVMLGLQRFNADGLGGERAYRAGIRVDGNLSYAHALGATTGVLLSVGAYSLGAPDVSALQFGNVPSLAALFPGSWQPLSRRILTGDVEARVTRSRVAITPRAGLRVVRSSQGLSQGWMASAGGGLEYRLIGRSHGRRLLVTPSFALRAGSVVSDVESSSAVRGWEVSLGLDWVGP
jgi:hypothetical protein